MARFARIHDGRVAEIITLPDGIQPEEAFVAEIAATIVACPATGVGQGAIFSNGEFSTPAPEIPTADALRAHAAATRFAMETAGIASNGAQISTDRASQSLIQGAFMLAQTNPDLTIEFKAANGFVTLDAATIQTVALAVAAHVQKCFAAERAVDAQIASGSITTFAGIDTALAGLI